MVDSDEDFERRNRDKFRHERSDYDQKDDRSRGQNRSNWSKNSRDRKDDRVKRRSPPRNDISPQNKRIRRDFRDDNYQHYEPSYHPRMHGPPHLGWSSNLFDHNPHAINNPGKGPETDFPTQPPMLSFKHFLATQDDNITDADSIRKYNKYKLDFKKEQIKEFFAQHKDEEWFRSKYHPEEYNKRQDEMKNSLLRRCQVFKTLDASSSLTTSLNMSCSDKLIKMLDSAVILMEGGVMDDLAVLDIKDEALTALEATTTTTTVATATTTTATSVAKAATTMAGVAEAGEKTSVQSGASEGATNVVQSDDCKEPEKDEKSVEGVKDGQDVSMEEGKEEKNEGEVNAEQDDNEGKKEGKEEVGEKKEEGAAEESKETVAKSSEPRPLHKTQSIFLRNLVPAITRNEVVSVCRRYPGFMRVCIQDPQPERRFVRRGWITFDRTVNVKDICWNLNNLRLRDCDMGAIVNRELRQRVRPVNGLTMHKVVARQDIKHAAKIIQHLDERWQLWRKASLMVEKVDEKEGKVDKDNAEDEAEKDVGGVDEGESNSVSTGEHKDGKGKPDDTDQVDLGFISNNPVLSNITDFLVDEADYEDELLGVTQKEKDASAEVTIEKDEELLKVLDRMLLYLRIVYSIDYYGAFEYQNEDDMPHRCGILHARGLNTTANITNQDVTEWMTSFETKLKSFLEPKFKLKGDEAEKLGLKKEDEEVEKFISANIQELGKDKWLCPLSGKKFKGPEFVRKHILTKHLDKIEEVKHEVRVFLLTEHPSAKVVPPPQMAPMVPSFPPFYRPPPAYPGMYTSHFSVRAPDAYRRDMGAMMRRDNGRLDPRPIIAYTDLDAPEID